MALRVVEPGFWTLVVDGGRPRERRRGVPVGGAADRRALAIGNALLGNPPDAAALELTLTGPTLRADAPTACVVVGATFGLVGDLHPAGLRAGKTFTLQAGETLRIGAATRGARGYLCVGGGFTVPLVLGSRSSLAPVRAGELLACAASETGSRFVAADWATPLEDAPIRLLEGGQTCWYDTGPLFATTYTVTSASNRMGLRLSGEPLRPRPGAACVEIASEPVCPGTVQVTRDGQCIILGVDGQTIGGYPKVGHVIRADWDRFGQLRPGEPLRFRRVELEEAESADRTAALELRRLLVRLAAQIPDSAS